MLGKGFFCAPLFTQVRRLRTLSLHVTDCQFEPFGLLLNNRITYYLPTFLFNTMKKQKRIKKVWFFGNNISTFASI